MKSTNSVLSRPFSSFVLNSSLRCALQSASTYSTLCVNLQCPESAAKFTCSPARKLVVRYTHNKRTPTTANFPSHTTNPSDDKIVRMQE